MLHVLEAARKSPSGLERIVITSTDKVYGEMEGASYLEESPLRGIGLYDAGKLAADVMARSYYHSFDTPITVVRLCNVFGPHDYNSGYRLFPKSLSRIFGPEAPMPPVLYYESISHWRDYVYIDDVVDALLHAALQPAARGEVFNMASAAHRSTPKVLKELVDMSVQVLAAIDPLRAELVQKNGILVNTCDQGAVAIRRQHLDASKISQVLGFDIRVSFERGLQLTVEHYAEQRYGRTA
jgi:nucleoside-diphosphate-sugar epimerase